MPARFLFLLLAAALHLPAPAQARLFESFAQLTQRYGPPTTTPEDPSLFIFRKAPFAIIAYIDETQRCQAIVYAHDDNSAISLEDAAHLVEINAPGATIVKRDTDLAAVLGPIRWEIDDLVAIKQHLPSALFIGTKESERYFDALTKRQAAKKLQGF